MTSVRLHFWIESEGKEKGEREGKERKKEGRGNRIYVYCMHINMCA